MGKRKPKPMPRPKPISLALSKDEMERLGHLVVDTLVDRFTAVEDAPAITIGDRKKLEKALTESLPENPTSFEEILNRLKKDVFPYGVRLAHPRFFAFVSSPGNFISALADALASGYNLFAGTWLGGSGAIQVELTTIRWLSDLCGLPETSGGLFTSGGSMANLTALATARTVRAGDRFRGTAVYFTTETHSSNERALRILGFSPTQLRTIEVDGEQRMDMKALREAMVTDADLGRQPLCVIATAGTTNVGAVDPLNDIADLCAEFGAWMHIDGAYGASAAISPRLRKQLAGMERADSISLDPHKWLFQPFEIGCVLVRKASDLRDSFQIMPDYLQDVHGLGEMNPADYGVQLTRNFRALKLWMSLQFYGAAHFRRAVEHGVAMAEYAEKKINSHRDFKLVTPARLGIVTFRFALAGMAADQLETVNKAIVEHMMADGFAMMSSTRLGGITALRFCIINPDTSQKHIDETLAMLATVGRDVTGDKFSQS